MILIELFILIEILMFVTFFLAFFFKQEILWAITLVLSGILMLLSYNVQKTVFVLDNATTAYVPVLSTFSFPYMMGINLLFFALAIILGLLDYFDKNSISILKFSFGKK